MIRNEKQYWITVTLPIYNEMKNNHLTSFTVTSGGPEVPGTQLQHHFPTYTQKIPGLQAPYHILYSTHLHSDEAVPPLTSPCRRKAPIKISLKNLSRRTLPDSYSKPKLPPQHAPRHRLFLRDI